MKKFLVIVVVALAIMGIVALIFEIQGHVEVQLVKNDFTRTVKLSHQGMDSYITLPNNWEPCQRLEKPLTWREKYYVYFIPSGDGVLEAQIYSKEDLRLLGTPEVKWYSGEVYACTSKPVKVKGFVSTALGEQVLVVMAGEFYLAGYPFDSTDLPQEVDYTHDEYIRTIEDGRIVLVSQENRFVLFIPESGIIATGKITKP